MKVCVKHLREWLLTMTITQPSFIKVEYFRPRRAPARDSGRPPSPTRSLALACALPALHLPAVVCACSCVRVLAAAAARGQGL